MSWPTRWPAKAWVTPGTEPSRHFDFRPLAASFIPLTNPIFKRRIMLINSSALETLAAFAIAFFGGIVCGLGLVRYGRYVREDARRGYTTV